MQVCSVLSPQILSEDDPPASVADCGSVCPVGALPLSPRPHSGLRHQYCAQMHACISHWPSAQKPLPAHAMASFMQWLRGACILQPAHRAVCAWHAWVDRNREGLAWMDIVREGAGLVARAPCRSAPRPRPESSASLSCCAVASSPPRPLSHAPRPMSEASTSRPPTGART